MNNDLYTNFESRPSGALEIAANSRETGKKMALRFAEAQAQLNAETRETRRRGLLAALLSSLRIF